jgi:hypothetical protein
VEGLNMAIRKDARSRAIVVRARLQPAAEMSRMASLAGVRLSVKDATWVANKVVQRDAAIQAVRKLPYRDREPANTLTLQRYE